MFYSRCFFTLSFSPPLISIARKDPHSPQYSIDSIISLQERSRLGLLVVSIQEIERLGLVVERLFLVREHATNQYLNLTYLYFDFTNQYNTLDPTSLIQSLGCREGESKLLIIERSKESHL